MGRSINTKMTQEVIAYGFKVFCKTITIPRNGGAREVQCVPFGVENHFHRIRVKRFFRIVDWHRQSRHTHLTLSEVISNLTNDCRRDHRFIPLHINDHRVVAECAFFDNFRQTFCS